MEMFGPCSEMLALLLQSFLVASLWPNKNQNVGGGGGNSCGIQIKVSACPFPEILNWK